MTIYKRFEDEVDEDCEAPPAPTTMSTEESASPITSSTSSQDNSGVQILMSYEEGQELEACNNDITEIPQDSLTEDARYRMKFRTTRDRKHEL